MRQPTSRLAPLMLAALLGACASPPPPPAIGTIAPPQWQAALPHNGQLTDLTHWWDQFNDPLLTQLITAAEAQSPTLASATSRIAQARATRVAAGAALLPSLGANASIQRGRQDVTLPLATVASVGLQASWEIDLFGANRSARDAAQARLDGAQASWHVARVSVAAETATDYLTLRACEAQVAQTQADSSSRNETARLTDLLAKSGFQSPANAALTRASAAQGNALLTAQRAQCDLAVKALVALTAIDEPVLRSRLNERSAQLPEPAQIAVQAVPAQVLMQRPDLYASGLQLVAASADVSQSEAQRLPSITLAGSIAATRMRFDFGTQNTTLWNLGPLAINVPLFDRGALSANVDAARARYDEALITYRSQLRGAVREVEEALVQLQSTADRSDDARVAAEGFDTSLQATQARYKSGGASPFELEEARRSDVQAHSALIDLQRERVAAWISLYRALGGGWASSEAAAPNATDTLTPPAAPASPTPSTPSTPAPK